MTNKILTFILFIYVSVLLPYAVYTKKNNYDESYFIKYIMQEFMVAAFKHGYNGTLYMKNSHEITTNDNNIDIIIANHTSRFDDILLIIITLHKFNISNYNFIYNKDNLHLIPGLGIFLKSSYDIGIDKNYSKDYYTIINGLNKINKKKNKEFIIIFPEGRIITKDKLEKDQLYSKENNIPIYNNLLMPKTRGVFLIIEYLKYLKRLGDVWDFTIYNNINNYYIDINKVTINYTCYDNFKLEFYKIWQNKDKLLENKKNNTEYNKIFFRNNYTLLLLLISIIVLQSVALCNFKYFILFIIKIAYHYFF